MKVVIYPTDTVWGIGASAVCEASVKKVNQIKKVEDFKPQSLLFPHFEALYDSIQIDKKLSRYKDYLEKLFSLGFTLALPKESLKLELAPSVLGNSQFVCMRVLSFSWIHEIYELFNSPITSTSLNITGSPPVSNFEEVISFRNKNCPDVKIFSEGERKVLSGTSSTIICLESDGYKIWREGKNLDEIEKLLSKMSLQRNRDEFVS